MKKLNLNIEKIEIRGSIHLLTEVVTKIDIAIQQIAQSTHQLYDLLRQYSSVNAGQQYSNAVSTILKNSEVLYDASVDFNTLQRDVVAYQNKVLRYEDLNDVISAPNLHLVERTSINVDTNIVQFSREEMVGLVSSMKDYSMFVVEQIKTISTAKNDIGQVWRDPQYFEFAEFCDEICNVAVSGLKTLDDYSNELTEKIKELIS